MKRPGLLRPVVVLGAATLALAACSSGTADNPSGGATGDSSAPVVLGSSLSMTGPLGQFGVALKAGYEQLVTDVNAAGGVDVDGKKRPLKLVVLDNRSDPNTTTQQTRELVLQDGAVAILGACTPPIVVPGALAAEQQKVPFVTTCAPVKAFQGGNPNGWHYAWDVFFDEQEQATHALGALAKAESGKKLAVFTDNEPDGVFERALYTASAPTSGLQVVGDYTFPVGTTDYSSFISDAKAKGADLVVAQMIPPDGIALWKQAKAANFSPKAAFVAKAATGASWGAGLGDVANGTLTEAWWSPTAGKGNTQALTGTLGKQFGDNISDLNIAVLGYSVANIASDAISAAGSTDPTKVNDAFAKTDKDYALGHVKFNDKGTAVTPILLLMQWQSGKIVQVDPPVQGSTFQVPVKGLQ